MWNVNLILSQHWQSKNAGYKVPKVQFSTMVVETWRDSKTDVNISGFKKPGILPCNDEVIPEDKFEPSALLHWKQQKVVINQLLPIIGKHLQKVNNR